MNLNLEYILPQEWSPAWRHCHLQHPPAEPVAALHVGPDGDLQGEN